jgi:uncharacterized RDD family membrane protein YckC
MNSITTTQMASIGSRFIALVIDGVVLGAVTSALYPILGNMRDEGVLTFALTIFYQWYFLTKYQGQTPGKMLLGIRVVKTDGSALSTLDAIVRTLGYTLNWILLGIGWLLAFWDSNHQGLHDRMADTYVVKVNQ